MKDELTGIDKENLIGYDFQGWPIYKKTLRQLLEELGAIEENNIIGFRIDNPILDIYPIKLEDDGMGYGINEQYFSCADTDNKKFINFFTEKPFNKEILEDWYKEQVEFAKEIKEYYDNRQLSTNKK